MLHALIKLLYRGFDCRGYSKKNIIVMAFFQKILRVNADVPWPVHWTSHVMAPRNITTRGEPLGYMPCCYIDGRNGIVLGKNVTVASHVKIISQNHSTHDFDTYLTQDPIVIGDNSWVGAGAIILPGVVLGNHTVVGAGSVVTKSFEGTNQVVAGNPARVVKNIGEYKKTTDHAI